MPSSTDGVGHAEDPVKQEIARMGDDDFQDREEATQKLWAMGSEVIPQLREAVKSPEPEIAKRASIVLRKLELGITPTTAPEIQTLVERYNRTSGDDRVRVMFELRQLRAWRQILKLYVLEKDPEIRAKLQNAVAGVGVSAARESLAAGNPAEARSYLEMCPDENEAFLPLAEFHRSHGTLNAELAKKNEISPRLNLALLRVSGDYRAAHSLATAQGDLPLANLFAMMDGDPLPYLRTSEASEGSVALHGIYLNLAEKRWKGGALDAEDLATIEPYDRGGDEGNRQMASNIQFLLGKTGPAEASLIKQSPIIAFLHFDLLERVPDAYRAVGLDPEKPDFAAWITKRFDQVTEENDDAATHRAELVMMGSFLERRGLLDALKAYDAPLEKLADKETDTFLEMLSSLSGRQESGTGAISVVKKATAAYAGEDNLKWEEAVVHIFADSGEVKDWWEWLAELQPSATPAARLDAMLVLFRFGPDPGHLRDAWLKRAWKALDEMPKENAESKLSLMSFLASAAQDLPTGLKAWDQMATYDDASEGYGNYLNYLSAANRWDQAAERWLKLSKKTPTNAEFHAYAAASLRRAGKGAEAAKEDDWADKLALADPLTCVRVGKGYAYGGDYERAGQWWERALIVSPPGTRIWQEILAVHALDRLHVGDWRRAAALYEVQAELQSSPDNSPENPGLKLRTRANADLAHAMALLSAGKENKDRAIASLKETHALLKADGSLADYFFPALRKAGLMEQHDAWFEQSWQALQVVLKAFPSCENTQNTAAWMAARAGMHLDEGEVLVNQALKESPGQAAYLDTKAEIFFARKDRKRAIELSAQSMESSPQDEQLRRQYERYRSDPFPIP